ncbi:MAG: hypothetical protein JWN70_2607 [Planctomycetaceae bacterium]|nr:hypothetical protein [Planctomycetaceae bacterium]
MPGPQTTVCTDCGGTMQEIKLIAKGYNYSADLAYAAIDAKRSFWKGTLPLEGTVRSYMCSGCSLIKTYGYPESDPSDLTSRPTE